MEKSIYYILIIALLANSHFVLAHDFEVNGLFFNYLEDNTCEVTFRGTGSNWDNDNLRYEGNIIIPSKVDYEGKTYTITAIGDNAFNECKNLTSVYVPNTINSIGNRAFEECYSLRTINIPSSISSIGQYAFKWCESLTSPVTIPNGVRKIEDGTFKNCGALSEVSIPNSVVSIGGQAFQGTGIKSINIPNSVKAIGDKAFCGCSIISIDYPDFVVDMGVNVFSECSDLTEIRFSESTKSISALAFSNCTGLQMINIPTTVNAIGRRAFSGCKGLTTLNIPNSVTDLGEEAFAYCSSLSTVNIDCAVIGKQSFQYCTALTSINLSDNVTSIGNESFLGCTALKNVFIPKSVTYIRTWDAFEGCTALQSFVVDSDNSDFSSLDGVLYNKEINQLLLFPFAKSAESFVIPNTVTSIGARAFFNGTKVKSLTIPAKVTSIGENAFYGNKGLSSLYILVSNPSKISLGKSVFDSNLTTLCRLYVPKSSIELYASADQWKSFYDIQENNQFNYVSSIQLNTTQINLVVSERYKLTGIVLPEDADDSTILWSSSNTSVATVDAEGNVTAVGKGTATITATANDGSGVKSSCIVSVIDSFKSIFNGKSISYHITSINTCEVCKPNESNSYSGDLEIPTTITFEGKTFSVTAIGKEAFKNCNDLTSIILPSSLKVLHDYAFAGCKGIKTIKIPQNLVEIHEGVFAYCTNLESVEYYATHCYEYDNYDEDEYDDYEDYLEDLYDPPFYDCTTLTEVVIGENVLAIPDYLFWCCTNITEIKCYREEPPRVGPIGFDSRIMDKCNVKVPDNSVEVYKASIYWKKFTKIMGLSTPEITEAVATPTFSQSGDKLTISCSTAGATIYYNIGGATPTNASTKYTGPITIADNRIVKAIAYANGFNPSSVATYTPNSAACQQVSISVSGTTATMTCATRGATIYYTLDGTTPTTASSKYSAPITLTQNCTIKAIAVKEDMNDSPVASDEVNSFTVATPTFSQNGDKLTISCTTEGATIYYTIGGATPTTSSTKYTEPIAITDNRTIKAIAVKTNFNNSEVAAYTPISAACQQVSISVSGTTATMTCATSGATIYYTLDGSTPTTASSKYSAPITLTQNCTIKAIAKKENMNDSPVTSYEVTSFTVATPTFSQSGDKLTISCTTEGATIYYTIGGATPTTSSTKYTEPITITDNRTIKAIAIKENFNNSEVATYTPNSAACQQVSISVSGTTATMTCTTSGATIYYTLDGSTPTTASNKYSAPITLTQNCTIEAIAKKENMNDSPVASYSVTSFTVATPTFSQSGDKLTISCTAEGATIYYTIGGATPTTSSTKYTEPITITDNRTIKAIAIKENFNNSEVATYTPSSAACQQVSISVSGTTATMTCATSGATIYYTLDGSTPTTASNKYSAPITLIQNCTIKAIAVMENMNDSEVASYNVMSFSCANVTMSYDGRKVSLSTATEGASIYFTKNGSTPLAASAVYTEPFDAGGIVTVKAVAMKENWNDSEVMEEKLPCYSDGRVIWIDEASALDKAMKVCGTDSLTTVVWNANGVLADDALRDVDNPNLLLYVKMRGYAPSGINNVVVNNQAEKIELVDGGNFFVPKVFTAKRISYTHRYSMQTPRDGSVAGWETIALPFDVQSIAHESHGTAAPFAANVSGAKPFWLYSLGSGGWQRAASIKANTPYIICMPNNADYADDYILAGDVTFSAENVSVSATEQKISQKDDIVFVPTTLKINQSDNMYAINKNEEYNGRFAGSLFVGDLRSVSPFEGYLALASDVKKPAMVKLMDVGFGDDASDISVPAKRNELQIHGMVGSIQINTDCEQPVKVYTVSGSLVRMVDLKAGRNVINGLTPGIYIVEHTKVLVK